MWPKIKVKKWLSLSEIFDRVEGGYAVILNPHAYAWGSTRVWYDDVGNTLAQGHG